MYTLEKATKILGTITAIMTLIEIVIFWPAAIKTGIIATILGISNKAIKEEIKRREEREQKQEDTKDE